MRARRLLLTSCLSLVCLAAASTAAQAACNNWQGPGGTPTAPTSGNWKDAGSWSMGTIPGTHPGTDDDVCITGSGSYTVTLAPYAPPTVGTASVQPGDSIHSLTLGATGGSGTQTLVVSGQSSQNSMTTPSFYTDLAVATTTSVSSSGAVTLDSTNTGTAISGSPTGGAAVLDPGTLTNAGTITTQSEDAAHYTGQLGGTINNTGTISIGSGGLHSPTQNLGGTGGQNAIALTNAGTISVASGDTWRIEEPHSGAANSSITNNSTITNNGTIVATSDGGGLTWNQSGGSITGNPVHVQAGAVLNDSAGTGAFVFDYSNAGLQGTIPSGQTVTLSAGSSTTSMNETSNEQILDLQGKALANNGTLVLDSTNGGPALPAGAFATVQDGSIDNHGTIEAKVDAGSTYGVRMNVGLTNEAGATVSVDHGQMFDGGITNHGTFVLGPAAQVIGNTGTNVTNAADGTIVPEISGPSSEGTFSLPNACCYGAPTFTAGGTVKPTPVGGYVPAAGSEYQLVALNGGAYSGTFGAFSAGWTPDYTKQMASPAFVGYVYGGAAPTPTPGPATTSVAPTVGSVAGGSGLKVTLSCAAGATCVATTIKATATVKSTVKNKGKRKTVTKQVLVASCTATPVAGAAKTVSCTPNQAGAALLKRRHSLSVKVTIASAGRTVATKTVKLTQAKKAKKPKKAKK